MLDEEGKELAQGIKLVGGKLGGWGLDCLSVVRVLAGLFSTVVLQDRLVRGEIDFCAEVFYKVFVFSNLLGDFSLC